MTDITNIEKQDLIQYVTEQHLTKKSIERIHNLCKRQPKLSLTVYRGHDPSSPTIVPSLWFSTSDCKRCAREEFVREGGWLFTIHLINVPAIDVNSFVRKEIKKYSDENEFIVLGGGNFYKNSDMTELGFLSKGNDEIECWYTIPDDVHSEKTTTNSISSQINIDNVNKAFNIILPDEYEFITSSSDIIIPQVDLTDLEKEQVYNLIQKQKHGKKYGGGKHKKLTYTRNRKSKLRTKRKTKKNKKSRKKA